MKTLEQHNRERQAAHDTITALLKPTDNGIACPRCEGELCAHRYRAHKTA